MTGANEQLLQQAATWHVASERDDMDWDGFTRWLEADPSHRAAYEQTALADALLVAHSGELSAFGEAPRDRPSRRWPLWIGGALAASLAAVLVVPEMTTAPSQSFTSGAQLRQIALQDGSQVVLAPQSRLTIAGRHAEQLALEGGALFSIRHDPNRTLTIAANGMTIADVGTRFEVQTGGGALRVEVSQGEVELRGDLLAKAVRLPAGRRILFDPTHELATVAPVSPRDVGEWQEGRLTYDAAPLSLVAADLARYAAVTVTVPPPLASRRFSGTLSIQNGETAVRDLAQLMGLALSHSGSAYRFSDGD
jgi:transmembrane sensor